MDWYLVFCEKENSYSIVNGESIISAGSKEEMVVELNDHVTFIYRNKPYLGIVEGMSDEREEMDELLKRKMAGKKGKGGKGEKHKSSQLVDNLQTKPKKKVPTEEATRDRIRRLNQSRAQSVANAEILDSVSNKSKEDPPYEPTSSDQSSQDSTDDEMTLAEFNRNNILRKQERETLLHKTDNSKSNVTNNNSGGPLQISASPSKEELKRMLEEYKIKLQMSYDQQHNNKERAPSAPDVSDFFDNNDQDLSVMEGGTGPSEDEEKIDNGTGKIRAPEGRKGNEEEKESSKKRKDETKKEMHQIKKTKSNAEEEDKEKTSPQSKKPKEEKPSNSKDEPEVDSDPEYCESFNYQLYGKQPDSVHLCCGIYCEARVVATAVHSATEMSHLVRRLLPGVFVADKLDEVTLTGRKPTAAGRGRIAKPKLDPLHPKAVSAIFKYCKAAAKAKKSWKVMSRLEFNRVVAQKLGEMKRGERKAD
ncbi:hypothetical protein KUF71_012094 [Frankliniella fusca]|uniref:BEN domain-containing protein n=1 Tax=Frankliniella fusca TaxID=407009 RepID=A0AAE1HK97_9NEOP|nr:hypothetical protein KUF71_012094 [Frankliniella fusca]